MILLSIRVIDNLSVYVIDKLSLAKSILINIDNAINETKAPHNIPACATCNLISHIDSIVSISADLQLFNRLLQTARLSLNASWAWPGARPGAGA